MKKIFIVIMLLLVAGFVQAESWLEVEWAFQFGWIPYGNISFYDNYNPRDTFIFNNFDAVFKIDALLFDHIMAGGSITNFFKPNSINIDFINFCPPGITYFVYFGISICKGITIIYEHSCSHPVVANFLNENKLIKLDSAYSRIFIEFKGTSFF